MGPSEREIERAIDALKSAPGRFQLLCEEYARLAFGERFAHLIPHGRRPDQVTVRGWPDAYAITPSNQIDILETTHSDRWERHLKSDLANARSYPTGKIDGFRFVAWASRPSHEKLDPYRVQLGRLGVTRERISFVFRQDLIAELRRPRYARIWEDLLDLPASALPFRALGNVPRMVSQDHGASFAPSWEEFAAGWVHEPSALQPVLKDLDARGSALVRGRGASGKTVLAGHVACATGVSVTADGPHLVRPVYYLAVDASPAQRGTIDAVTAITTRADRGVLFIVDDIHLDPEFAADLFETWKDAGQQSRLLLLGRHRSVDASQTGGLPQYIERREILLRVGGADLIGVYRRLARTLLEEPNPPEPPPAAVDDWLALFGGDLVAFSTAVAGQIRALDRGQWRLKPEAAADHVRQKYLRSLSREERFELHRVAVLARWELPLPSTLAPRSGLEAAQAMGIVLSENPLGQGALYRLAHAGLGSLILSADVDADPGLVSRELAIADPSLGLTISLRLMSDGAPDEARQTLRWLMSAPRGANRAIANSGSQLERALDAFSGLGLLSADELANLLEASADLL